MKKMNLKVDESFFSPYTSKLKLKEKNYLRILNEVGNSFAYNLLGFKEDILFQTKVGEDTYIFCDGELSRKIEQFNFNAFLNKPTPFLEQVKLTMDYHINSFKTFFIQGNLKKIIHHYVNFYAGYTLYAEYKKQIEKQIEEMNVPSDELISLIPSFNFSLKDDLFYEKYIPALTHRKITKKQLIEKRKEAIRQDERKYYLFNLIDFSVYYLDSYYVLSKLVSEFIKLKRINPPHFLELINNCFYEKAITSTQSSFYNYENLNYFNLKTKDEKLTYFVNIGRMLEKRKFTKEEVIKNYPKLPLSTLDIQKELKIK